MSIPSVAYKASLLSLLHALGANMPGAQDLVEKFEAAGRDEEWGKHELKEDCRWNGGHGTDGLCTCCPLNGTRYCP